MNGALPPELLQIRSARFESFGDEAAMSWRAAHGGEAPALRRRSAWLGYFPLRNRQVVAWLATVHPALGVIVVTIPAPDESAKFPSNFR